jgi:hypothetical protein
MAKVAEERGASDSPVTIVRLAQGTQPGRKFPVAFFPVMLYFAVVLYFAVACCSAMAWDRSIDATSAVHPV